jgi:EAL domain-containing protein (putative c-di-GMP-specific phosphodiesterase class I)
MRDQAGRRRQSSGRRFLEDSITASIERALETDGFSIMYQPIISLMGDSQEHYSVLLRLRREHERMLTANELLGPAARAGTLPDVDRWVIQRALEEQAKRRRLGQKVACFLSLSAEIVQDDRLLIWICDALREFEVRGSWVTFQFQERDALSLADKWNKLAEGLKKIKCRICINQFGMQKNPELAMTTMGADYVKFAPELAIGLANDPAMQRRLLQLIKMAQDNKVKTIVTGVEDARSLALLWGAGIDYVQGNFLQSAMQSMDTPTLFTWAKRRGPTSLHRAIAHPCDGTVPQTCNEGAAAELSARIGDAVGHVPGGHQVARIQTVVFLVVEEDVGIEALQERPLV